jgi:type I restriction enzyme R subunit
MIGRGTRLCPELLDGEDKKEFFIFDLCGNFAFFRAQPRGLEPGLVVTLQERLFNLKVRMMRELQDVEYQSLELRALRERLVDEAVAAVGLLNRDAFDVRQHLRYVDKFSCADEYVVLGVDDVTDIANHVAPLVLPSSDDASAVRFDALIYQIELALLQHRPIGRAKGDALEKARALSKCGTMPMVAAQKDLLVAILHDGYLDALDVSGYEDIRLRLRDLLIFIPFEERRKYDTDFTDDILYITVVATKPTGNTLESYRRSIEWYLLQHEDEPAIAKIKNNVPLAEHDVQQLETYFWIELGTKEQYEANFGSTPIGELVRSVVGLSQEAANTAFSAFLNTGLLEDSRQQRFVKLLVDYIVKRGMMKDLSVLQGSPFSDQGSLAELFDTKTFMDLRRVIDEINGNASAA